MWKNIISWFKSWVSTEAKTFEDYAQHAWSLLEPFIMGALQHLGQDEIAALKDIALTAVQTVEAQGLPTSIAKAEAWAAIVGAEAVKQEIQVGEDMLNWLRENALQILKSWQATQGGNGNDGNMPGGETATPVPAS